jgi:hypothetical protein
MGGFKMKKHKVAEVFGACHFSKGDGWN